MTGKVGREADEEEKEEIKDEQVEGRKKKRQSSKPPPSRSKKDTIIGLTDAYAGGGEDEWGEFELRVFQPREVRKMLTPARLNRI